MSNQKIKKADLSQINYTPIEGEVMLNSQDNKYYVWQLILKHYIILNQKT